MEGVILILEQIIEGPYFNRETFDVQHLTRAALLMAREVEKLQKQASINELMIEDLKIELGERD